MSNYSNTVAALHKLIRHVLGLGPAEMPILGLDDAKPGSDAVEQAPGTDGILGSAVPDK